MRKFFSIMVVTIAALAGLPQARAAERVTLRNGFVQLCDHHAQVEGRVRLYLSPGEDNYIEFAPEQIAAIEFVPDPPAPAAQSTPQASAKRSETHPSRPGRDAHPRRQGAQSGR